MRARHVIVPIAVLLAAACADSRSPLEPVDVGGAIAALSDASFGGTPHVFFLPPMVANPTVNGAFDAALSPVVEICALVGTSCGTGAADLIATFTMTSGPGSETIRVSSADEHYLANWHTDEFGLSVDKNYRITVRVAGVEVAHADVDVVSTAGQLKKLGTSEAIPLVDGRTLPIKFRIEQGMVVAIQVTPNPLEILLGQSAALTATALDAHGSIVSGAPVVWSSADASIATVNSGGTVSGASVGATSVSASLGLVSGSAQVVVLEPCLAPMPDRGFWTFEEGSGSTTADLTNGGHNGTLQGTPQWVAGVFGQGGALDFDDATDLVNIGSFLSPGVTALTVSAWVNPSSFSNTGDVAAGGVSGPRIISATDGGGWAIGHTPGNGRIQVELRGIASFVVPDDAGEDDTFQLAQWSNVVVVYNGSSVVTYLNGVVVDTRAAAAGTVQQASSCTFIGNEPEGCSRQTNGNFAWQGSIDEVAVYGRALTNDEVLALYSRCLTSSTF